MDTINRAAFRILAANIPERERRRRMAELEKSIERALHGGPCPECGAKGPHEDNGARNRRDLSFLCTACWTQWDAEQE
jgi:hypothetical protein